MILKTKIPVIFNDPSKMAGSTTGVLIGALQNVSRSGQSYLGANYAYAKEDGATVMKAAFELVTEQAIIDLNDLIKNDLPSYDTTPEPYFEELKYMLAFRLEMVSGLMALNPSLTPSDISIEDGLGNVII